ncbi:MAG: hypothetical protein IKV90_11765 [Clostridia bacterium]|nr:hypothetical protein [Clostridia bacterium]
MSGRIAGKLQGCGLPADALEDCARVTLLGRSEVTIEGQHGVIELSSARIRLRTGLGILSISGDQLTLHALCAERARITGERIDDVSYL